MTTRKSHHAHKKPQDNGIIITAHDLAQAKVDAMHQVATTSSQTSSLGEVWSCSKGEACTLNQDCYGEFQQFVRYFRKCKNKYHQQNVSRLQCGYTMRMQNTNRLEAGPSILTI